MPCHTLRKCAVGAVIVTAATMGLAVPASATLIGDTITITSQANIPVDTWTDTVVVGAAAELVGGGASNHANTNQGQVFAHLYGGDSYDVGADTITIVYGALGAGGFLYSFTSVFSGLDWQGEPGILESVMLAAGAMGLVGSNISNVTDTGFTFQGTVDLVSGANFTLNLMHGVPPQEVSEPATLPILVAGLLVLMAMRRKRIA